MKLDKKPNTNPKKNPTKFSPYFKIESMNVTIWETRMLLLYFGLFFKENIT